MEKVKIELEKNKYLEISFKNDDVKQNVVVTPKMINQLRWFQNGINDETIENYGIKCMNDQLSEVMDFILDMNETTDLDKTQLLDMLGTCREAKKEISLFSVPKNLND